MSLEKRKTNQMIYPIILCGGSGTRLWPLSRKSYPKQFSPLVGECTLFQQTVKRTMGARFAKPTIVTNDKFRFTVLDELSDIKAEARQIILEPSARNTAPAVLAGILDILSDDANAKILILPSDHAIKDVDAFINAAIYAEAQMDDDQIVTFGIHPTHAETGYGYLEVDADKVELGQFQTLSKFVEKPARAKAEAMIASGQFVWNAGIFMGCAQHLAESYKTFEPEIFVSVKSAMAGAMIDLAFLRPETDAWNACKDISIDYAIMERATKLAVVTIDAGWSDLGDWKAVWQVAEKNARGVATSGEAIDIDCQNTLLRSDKSGTVLVGVGLEDVFAVAMHDAVVVGKMDRAQDVKLAVAELKAKGMKQAEEFPRDHRPWGWYETLVMRERFQVKRIVVKPGAQLSLQSHMHRAEHWTVVEGSARVTIDDQVTLLSENESCYIPLGAVHRLENPGKIPLTLIEVQSGSYLGEDDITRYEDTFGRS